MVQEILHPEEREFVSLICGNGWQTSGNGGGGVRVGLRTRARARAVVRARAADLPLGLLRDAKLSDDRIEVVGDSVGGDEDDVAGLDGGHAASQVAQLGVDPIHWAQRS